MSHRSRFAGARCIWIRIQGTALGCVLWLYPQWTAAHDLTIDSLELRVEPRRLAGELVLDPDLTRGAATEAARETAVLELVQDQVRIEIDGRERPISFSLRELYAGDGATAGDLIALRVPLVSRPQHFRVFIGTPLKAIALSVDTGDVAKDSVQSVLVEGGTFSPLYTLGESELATNELATTELVPTELAPTELAPTELAPTELVPSSAVTPKAEGFARERSWGTFVQYLKLGFEHIVPGGLDHVLFVVALVLGCSRLRTLGIQLTRFTVAHTLTLALGALGVVNLPPRFVEPLIALSIGFVAIENVVRKHPAPHRPLVVFGFGLLHGLGFAGALAETGLARGSLVVSLLAFNLGVELGQLTIVLVLLALFALFAKHERWLQLVFRPTSMLIAGVAGYWAVQRLFA